MQHGALIKQGRFSKVYSAGPDHVAIVSEDPIKEGLALFGTKTWKPGQLFMPLERVDDSTYKQRRVWVQRGVKHYVSKHQWQLYQWLRKNTPRPPEDLDQGYNILYEFFNAIPEQWAMEKEELHLMLSDLSMYGRDIMFEISPRNVGTYQNNLILLDVFFLMKELPWRKKYV